MGVEGEMPKYGVNEDLINKAGMKVNSNMLNQAIKTKEDWENLFGKASEQISHTKGYYSSAIGND